MPINAVDMDRSVVRDHGFRAFVELAWKHADRTDYEHAPHIKIICDRLQYVAEQRQLGKPTKSAIAVPFGASKSMVASVLWHAYVWGPMDWQESVWITSAHDDKLAHKFSRKTRDLILGPWFKARWPVELKEHAAGYWTNTRGGARIATGIGSRVTGEHGHFVLLDDPVKEQLTRLGTPYQIAQAVERSVEYWFGTLSSRVKDYIGARVLIHQRLHLDDPIGVALRKHDYDPIVLPARYSSTCGAPGYKPELDHRTVDGELLCSRMSEETIAEIAYELGPSAMRAQGDQDPEPLGGAILEASYMMRRWKRLPSELVEDMKSRTQGYGRLWIIVGDMALKSIKQSKALKGPDWVVFQCWCAFERDFYLIDQVRGQWGYRQSKQQLGLFALRHPQVTKILLEDAANAPALEDDVQELDAQSLLHEMIHGENSEIDALRVEEWAHKVKLEPHGGGCLARTQSTTGIWAANRVVLPADAPFVDSPDGFVDEHLRYAGDDVGVDDQVAASSLGLLHMKGRGLPRWAQKGAA